MLTVVFDACVLYPAPVRDFLMRLAIADLFLARWSGDIHEEWIRNVLAPRPDLRLERLERTRELMDENVRDCLVTGYEPIIPELELPDPDDRHVLAAAIRAGADVIVTYNLRDFPNAYTQEFGVLAQHPDDFVTELLTDSAPAVCEAARRHRASLRNPPKSVEEYLDTLGRQHFERTVEVLREFGEVL